MSIESQLREALAARAAEVAVDADDPYERVAGAIAASRRRRRSVAAGAVAAVAAVAVAVPLLGQGKDRTAPPARHHQTVAPVPTDPALWKSMRTWPTRGGLAGDTAFVEGVTQQVAPEGNALYAADLTRNRVVVFWVPSDDPSMPDGVLRVASGPRGAAADALATQHEEPATSADAVVFREGADGGGRLVVLTRPSEREAQLSDGVRVNADGTVSRTWQPMPLTGGIGTAQPLAPMGLGRVKVAGYDGPVSLTAGSIATAEHTFMGSGVCLDCTGSEFRVRAQQATSESVAQQLGFTPSQVATATRYSGPVDPSVVAAAQLGDEAMTGGKHALYVADTTVPGAGVLRSVFLVSTYAAGTGSAQALASGVPIDADTAAQHPVVVGGRRGSGALVEVFVADGAAVRLVSGAPSLWPHSARVPLIGGRAGLDLADPDWRQHYRVEVFDDAGRSRGTFAVDLPNADDPFDVQPDQ